jgi:MFS family permease
VVYAAMQIPVGILLDRFGPKALLAVGAFVMAAGQLTVAFAPNLATAVVGRMLVGMGDSFTFISMIRMINGWYQGAKASRMQQYISSAGQLGQFFSAVPFWWMLESLGWNPAFSIMSAVSLVTVALVIIFTADDAPSKEHVEKKKISLLVATRQLKENIANPGIRMSFWTHFVTQPTTTSIQLLWAVPFLVTAQGQSHDFASLTLTSMVVFGFFVAPVIANLCSRRPQWRGRLVYALVGVVNLTWVFVVLQPEALPAPVLFICMLLISIGGPASMIAFDFSKDIVDKSKLGSANGFANVGGFLATFIMMYLVGWVIDLVHGLNGGLERYTIEGFRAGFAAQMLITVVGITFFTVERRRFIKQMSLTGNNQPT